MAKSPLIDKPEGEQVTAPEGEQVTAPEGEQVTAPEGEQVTAPEETTEVETDPAVVVVDATLGMAVRTF